MPVLSGAERVKQRALSSAGTSNRRAQHVRANPDHVPPASYELRRLLGLDPRFASSQKNAGGRPLLLKLLLPSRQVIAKRALRHTLQACYVSPLMPRKRASAIRCASQTRSRSGRL